jgi:hypothetical protein
MAGAGAREETHSDLKSAKPGEGEGEGEGKNQRSAKQGEGEGEGEGEGKRFEPSQRLNPHPYSPLNPSSRAIRPRTPLTVTASWLSSR